MIERYDQYRSNFIRSSIEDVQDPLFLTFGLKFHFYPRSEPGESLNPGLLTGDAEKFLSSRGDTLRKQKLSYFKTLLRKFTINEPWWFTQIDGLNELLKFRHGGARLPENTSIGIHARESLDMKFLSFMESYRSVEFDKQFMREILPKNMKKFDMSIYLTDLRVLVKTEDNRKSYENDQQGVIVLKLYDCEFDFRDHGSFLNIVQNEKQGEPVTHKFNIQVKRIYEEYNLPTGELFGYSGQGYYSDDLKEDFNFIANTLRPKSMMMAEIGNERKIREEDYQRYVNDNDLKITNVAEEELEQDNELQEVPVEGKDADTELQNETLDIISKNPQDIKLEKLNPKSNFNNSELDPDVLNVLSTNRRTIL